MQINTYKSFFNDYFNSDIFMDSYIKAVESFKQAKRIFFIGNGGSNAICSHMAEDYMKIAKFPTFSFSDAALITCFANDYGYEYAMLEWLKVHVNPEVDLLVAISSSGESKNILNCVEFINETGGTAITFSGFKQNNSLSKMKENLHFHLPISNYGIVECFHEIILHSILDEISILNKEKKQ